MTSLTQRLPIALIPEQPLVSTVWDDVIHHGCSDNLSFRLAKNT